MNEAVKKPDLQSTSLSRRPYARARRVLLAVLLVIVAVFVALVLGIRIYASSYYHAAPEASEALASTSTATVMQLDNGDVTFVPAGPSDNVKAALVFYPGGKVEATAYAPLLARLADEGVASVLVRMPENLAVLAPGRAERGRDELTAALAKEGDSPQDAGQQADIPWMIGGHSLGGAMAAQYASKHAADYQGLVLLAAYSAFDLTDTDLHVLLCSGSNDGVMSRESYDKDRANLPQANVTEITIDGGIHSYFGCYGHQEGDGTPTITNDEQLDQTATAIVEFAQGL